MCVCVCVCVTPSRWWLRVTSRTPFGICLSWDELESKTAKTLSNIDESCHTWKSHVTYELGWVPVTCRIWMSHVTYRWVMSHMEEWFHIWVGLSSSVKQPRHHASCRIWMSHVTYDWVMSHRNEWCHIWMRRVTHESVMSWKCGVLLCASHCLAPLEFDVYVSTHLFMYVSMYLSMYVCVYLSVSVSVYLSMYLHASISIFIFPVWNQSRWLLLWCFRSTWMLCS